MKSNTLFNISKFISTINVQNDLVTKLVYTKQIDKALHLAETMYLDLPEDSPVKEVIDELCNKPVKVTGYINHKNNLESNTSSVFNFESGTFKPYVPKSAGVYLVTHTLTDKQYIGSAMNFQDRMQMHRHDSKHPSSTFHKFVSKNSWTDFVFGTVYETTNYLREFKYKYPKYILSQGEMIILSHLTHLETRTLEQSLITKFDPELNGSKKDVVFTYSFWDPSLLNKSYNPKSPHSIIVEVLLDNKDVLTTYPSIQKTAEGLGVSRPLINRYLNRPSSFKSPIFELNVSVRELNGTMLDTPVIYSNKINKKYLPIDFDINSLEKGLIYALNPTNLNIEYKFESALDAARSLNPIKFKTNSEKIDGRSISRYYNLERLVSTELGSFYFVCNPENIIKSKSMGIPKLVWIINLNNGLALKFNNMVEASKYLKLNSHGSISKHFDKYTIYNKSYQFFSDVKFLEHFPNAQKDVFFCSLNKLPLKK